MPYLLTSTQVGVSANLRQGGANLSTIVPEVFKQFYYKCQTLAIRLKLKTERTTGNIK